MASPAENEKVVREALRFDCDPISEAIGEGCGECAGCEGYAALAALRAQAEAGTPSKVELWENRGRLIVRAEAAEARLADAHEALRAYDVAFGEWAKLVEMTLSREACEQWQSIARAALTGEPA